MHTALDNVNSIEIIAPIGRLDSYSVPQFKEQIDGVVDSQSLTHMIVDLADVTFIDSRALAAIVHGMHVCRLKGGDLCLASPNQSVRRILELTSLDKAISVFADRAEALASYAD